PEVEPEPEVEQTEEDNCDVELETEPGYTDCGFGLPALEYEAAAYRAEYTTEEIELKYAHGNLSEELFKAILFET
ncbi:hypothetical protein KO498_10270, partial [Lentibacter algarum]|uniref:hypothetical protein n=1 Tax=Lentibacter algarum TaxID=576131 RepID=UPI001C07E447